MKWVIVVLGILSNASASVLIKIALLPPRKLPSLNDIPGTLANWPLWLGVVLYGTTFLLYTAALTRLPLNIAHPVMTTGAVAAVALSSAVVLREPFYWTTAIGIALVVVGVLFLSARAA